MSFLFPIAQLQSQCSAVFSAQERPLSIKKTLLREDITKARQGIQNSRVQTEDRTKVAGPKLARAARSLASGSFPLRNGPVCLRPRSLTRILLGRESVSDGACDERHPGSTVASFPPIAALELAKLMLLLWTDVNRDITA